MQKQRIWVGLLGLAIVAVLLAGCGGAATTEPTVPADEVPVVPGGAAGAIVAEAVIEPAHWSELYFNTTGQVAETLVAVGETVSTGDPLVRLDTTLLELQLQQALLELESAENRYEQQLAEAALNLQTAEARLAQLQARFPSLVEAEIALEHAIEAEETAAIEYDQAQGRVEEWVIEQVREAYTENLENAQENLAIAQANYDAIRGEQYAQTQELAILEQGVEQARLQLEQVQAGREVEGARLRAAQAQAELDRATLTAPFDGIVAALHVDAGDMVGPGATIVVVATLGQFQARTVDLTELDIARIVVGQAAVVTVDALPELELSGHVARISLQSVDYRGDTTYPIIIELDESAAELWWGMTAVAEIEAE